MMSISQIEPTKIAKQRVANFLIAALCYLLLFVFIFNVKAAVIELKESGTILFASSEMISNNNELNEYVKEDNANKKPLLKPIGNDVYPTKSTLVRDVKNMPNMADDFIPSPQPVAILASLNFPNELQTANQAFDNIAVNKISANANSQSIEKPHSVKENNNIKDEIDVAKSQYIEKIIARIERKKAYPLRARELKMEGVVIISMKISQNGVLSSVRIVKSSNIQMLDDAALNAVKSAAPFEKFPYNIVNDSLSIETPIEFEIKV